MEGTLFFIRGINVGGHKVVRMQALREIMQNAGFNSVTTYIQSGNIWVSNIYEEALKTKLIELFQDALQWEVQVIALPPKRLKKIWTQCPFNKAEKEKSYFMLVERPLNKAACKHLNNLKGYTEKLHATPDCVYFFKETAAGKSILDTNYITAQYGAAVTTRNYNTIQRMLKICGYTL